MGEFLPLLFGVVVGLLALGRPPGTRLWAACGLALVAGPAASWINGELEEVWPILFDTAQVLAAAAMTVALTRVTGHAAS